MHRVLRTIIVIAAPVFVAGVVNGQAQALTPEQDRVSFRAGFAERFPGIDLEDFADGAYVLDPGARAQWLEMEAFPPYEFALERGAARFREPFGNGRSYADCFASEHREHYPRFDQASGEIVTLELALNRCREANHAEALAFDDDRLIELAAYVASLARGRPLSVQVRDDPRALAAFRSGQEYFFTRRGRLELSCADCHQKTAGRSLRGITVSPALGHPTHWPAYRLEWGALGSLHRRFADCNEGIGATPLPAQSREYLELEYFLTYMSNGLGVNAPGLRR